MSAPEKDTFCADCGRGESTIPAELDALKALLGRAAPKDVALHLIRIESKTTSVQVLADDIEDLSQIAHDLARSTNLVDGDESYARILNRGLTEVVRQLRGLVGRWDGPLSDEPDEVTP